MHLIRSTQIKTWTNVFDVHTGYNMTRGQTQIQLSQEVFKRSTIHFKYLAKTDQRTVIICFLVSGLVAHGHIHGLCFSVLVKLALIEVFRQKKSQNTHRTVCDDILLFQRFVKTADVTSLTQHFRLCQAVLRPKCHIALHVPG